MASVHKREWISPKGEPKMAWEVRWRDGDRRPSKGGFLLKKDAVAFQRRVEREIEQGTHISPSRMLTVRQVCEEFMRFQEDRLRDGRIGKGTHILFGCELRNTIFPHFGAMKIAEVTALDIENAYRKMIRADGLKPATAKDRIQTFRLICRFALRRGHLKVEVVSDALHDLRGVSADPIRTFERDDVLALLKALEQKPDKAWYRVHAMTKCFVHLAGFCGMRFGEIAGLTVRNLDFERRIIKVRHSMTAFNELKTPKTRAGVRDIPMPQHVALLLAEYVRDFTVANERGLVFVSLTGQNISGPGFHEHNWRPLLKRVGLDAKDGKRFHFHALRHFAASWWISMQMSLVETASLLGHKKFDTTLQTYAHPIAGGHGRLEVMDRMAAGLLAAPVTIDGDVIEASQAFA